MKIIITGSLGHISKPLTQKLVQKGHEITVISSNVDKQNDINALGATAAIGSMEDVEFLTKTFTGADAVYVMTPPAPIFNHDFDPESYYRNLGNNYAQAILKSGLKRVVNLSSIGAHIDKGSGIILYSAHQVENILKTLPNDIAITFLRPVGFFYNLLANAEIIKNTSKGILGVLLALRFYGLSGLFDRQRGVIVSNYGANDRVLLVSPVDIAAVAAEEITQHFLGRKIRYIASEELTCNEVAKILGEAIGKPYLKWGVISNKQLLNILNKAGINSTIAQGFVDMNAMQHSGKLYEDYYLNRPILGKTKLKEFVKEFAKVYYQE